MKKFSIKKILSGFLKAVYFSTGFFFLFSGRACAYIDSSATTYIIQIVAALMVAVGAVVTVLRHKIASLFKGKNTVEKREIHVKEEPEQNEDHQ